MSLILTAAALTAVDVEPAKLATADAAPLDPGAWELALGGTWTTAGRGLDDAGSAQDRGGRLREAGMGIGLTHGLVDGLDAGFAIGWSRIADDASEPDHGSGSSDLELGAKWRCCQSASDDGAWAVALLPALIVPLGRGQDAAAEIPTASRCWSAGLAAAASGSCGILACNADIGYCHAIGSEQDRDGYIGSIAADAALGLQVTDILQPEIELNWARDRVEDGTAPWSLAVTAGVQIGLPIGRLGVGAQRVVDGAAVDVSTTAIADLAIAF
ncbi:MAG: hypothetical protein J0M02_07440 [Planctomycetes bacterium]|nr:hypothetical protein [Planctomycetota bacterium]